MRLEKNKKPKLLLHICCIGCGAYVSSLLRRDFEVELYFYNPNIYPESEHGKRLEEINRVAGQLKLKVVKADYDHAKWLNKIRGLEKEKERGKRCLVCYHDRLEATAFMAKQKGFNVFTSTLSVSPHKLANRINSIGQALAIRHGIDFYESDFKKQDGFKKAVQMSKELDLYRQDYCGCEFSMKK